MGVRLEAEIKQRLEAEGNAVKRYGGALLFEPETARTQSNEPFRVFSPFWRVCLAQPQPRDPLPVPQKWRHPEAWPASDHLEDWKLRPTRRDWSGGLAATWQPGEAGAQQRLHTVIDGPMRDDAVKRDLPAELHLRHESPFRA